MKKLKITVLIFLSFTLLLVPMQIARADNPDFSYWYSNVNYVYYLRPSVLNSSTAYWKIISCGTNDTVTGDMIIAASHASVAWSNKVGITLSQNNSNGIITIYAGDAHNETEYQPGTALDGNTAGFTNIIEGTTYYEHNGSYSGSTVTLRSMVGANIFAIFTGEPYNLIVYYRIVTHEMGHALGYAGHNSSDDTALMWGVVNPNALQHVIVPQTSDKNHLTQIYSYTLNNLYE